MSRGNWREADKGRICGGGEDGGGMAKNDCSFLSALTLFAVDLFPSLHVF